MRTILLALVTIAGLALPHTLSAQGLALAGRAGTLGLGAEAAVGLGERLALRGGVGLLPFEPSVTIEDIDFTLSLPDTWFNIGADLYLGGGFRLGGGMLFKSDDPSIDGRPTESVEIGGRDYTPEEIGNIVGTFDSGSSAPYVLLGFGRHVLSGIGLFADFGVAFMGEQEVGLEAPNTNFDTQIEEEEFRARLEEEERDFEEDAGSYLDYWPILNIGVKIGLGR